MERLAINLAMRLLGRLPGWLLRAYYRGERLSRLVAIDVRPRGDQVTFDCGDTPHVRAWLAIRNLAPFRVTVDRARIEVWSNGRIGELWLLDRQTLGPGEATEALVTGLQGGRYEKLLRYHSGRPACSLQIRAHYDSKVGRFVGETGELEGVKVEIVNTAAHAGPAVAEH